MNTIQKAIIKLYEDSGFEKVQTYFSENEKHILNLSKKDLEEIYLLLARLSIISENFDFAQKIINRIEFEDLKFSADKLELVQNQLKKKEETKNKQLQQEFTQVPRFKEIKVQTIYSDKTPYECLEILNYALDTDVILCFDSVETGFSRNDIEKLDYKGYSRWSSFNEIQDKKTYEAIKHLLPEKYQTNTPKLFCYRVNANIHTVKIDYKYGNEKRSEEAVKIINFSTMVDAIIVDHSFIYSELHQVSGYSNWNTMTNDELNNYNRITQKKLTNGYICKLYKTR